MSLNLLSGNVHEMSAGLFPSLYIFSYFPILIEEFPNSIFSKLAFVKSQYRFSETVLKVVVEVAKIVEDVKLQCLKPEQFESISCASIKVEFSPPDKMA